MRRWTFEAIDRVDNWFHRFVNYLEGIEDRLRCRIVFEAVTRPMKHHYRELAKR
jgi:hypothetical protein